MTEKEIELLARHEWDKLHKGSDSIVFPDEKTKEIAWNYYLKAFQTIYGSQKQEVPVIKM